MRKKLMCILLLILFLSPACVRAQDTSGFNNATKTRFQGIVNLGFHATPGYPILSPYTSVSFGERINERAYIGAGIGIFLPVGPWYKTDEDLSYRDDLTLETALPAVYFQSDVYFGKWGNWMPYATASLGFATFAGYAKLGIGTDYKAFTMQVGYSPVLFISRYGGEYNNGLYIDFGYRFNSLKYNRERYKMQYENSQDTADRSARFQGTIGGGVQIGFPRIVINPYTDLILGVRIKEKAFVGAGIGLFLPIVRNYGGSWHDGYLTPSYSIRGDIYILDHPKVRQFISIQSSYAIYENDNYKHFIRNKVGYGLDFRKLTAQAGYISSINVDYGSLYHGFFVELGYRFNTHKYDVQHNK